MLGKWFRDVAGAWLGWGLGWGVEDHEESRIPRKTMHTFIQGICACSYRTAMTESTELHTESCDSVDSAFKLLYERMIKQYGPRLILVVLVSNVEEVLEGEWTHVRNGRNMDKEAVPVRRRRRVEGGGGKCQWLKFEWCKARSIRIAAGPKARGWHVRSWRCLG